MIFPLGGLFPSIRSKLFEERRLCFRGKYVKSKLRVQGWCASSSRVRWCTGSGREEK